MVRTGRLEGIRPELLQYCIEQRDGRDKMSNEEFRKQMRLRLKSAQVICSTCVGAGSESIKHIKFKHVLVDECTQATETATLCAIVKGCEQLVLVGDHCQLRPTVMSREAEMKGLCIPLFTRMVMQGVEPYMLDTQYRMHPAISEFPADFIYAGRLQTGVRAADRPTVNGFQWPRPDVPVAFTNCSSPECKEGNSFINDQQATDAVGIVMRLIREGLKPKQIGIITP